MEEKTLWSNRNKIHILINSIKDIIICFQISEGGLMRIIVGAFFCSTVSDFLTVNFLYFFSISLFGILISFFTPNFFIDLLNYSNSAGLLSIS